MVNVNIPSGVVYYNTMYTHYRVYPSCIQMRTVVVRGEQDENLISRCKSTINIMQLTYTVEQQRLRAKLRVPQHCLLSLIEFK